jgi:DNA invertase Pin-like site-specific DNA recombinase
LYTYSLRLSPRSSDRHPPAAPHLLRTRLVLHEAANPMKPPAIYTRVSTCDQNPETKALDLRRLAAQRGFEIIQRSTATGSAAPRRSARLAIRCSRPPTAKEFDTVLVSPADPLARSVRHFLQGSTRRIISVSSSCRSGKTSTIGAPLGRALVGIVSAVAELKRNLIIIIERVKAGLRRARLEGRVLSRKPLESDRVGLLRDRTGGLRPLSAREGLQDFPDQRCERFEVVRWHFTEGSISTHLSRH